MPRNTNHHGDGSAPLHRISLAGPWEFSPTEPLTPDPITDAGHSVCEVPSGTTTATAPSTGLSSQFPRRPARIRLPASSTPPEIPHIGSVTLTRRFHRPTNLDPHEQVWIVFEDPRCPFLISMNGEQLGEASPSETTSAETSSQASPTAASSELIPCAFEVTRRLNPSNSLAIHFQAPHATPTWPHGGPFGNVFVEMRMSSGRKSDHRLNEI